MSGKTTAIVIVIGLIAIAISYAGIFGYMTLSTQLQLLLQVVGIATIVLGVCAKGFYALNRSIDQTDRS